MRTTGSCCRSPLGNFVLAALVFGGAFLTLCAALYASLSASLAAGTPLGLLAAMLGMLPFSLAAARVVAAALRRASAAAGQEYATCFLLPACFVFGVGVAVALASLAAADWPWASLLAAAPLAAGAFCYRHERE